MDPYGFRDLILYFAAARDRFTRDGKQAEAQSCEDAIALAHRIETAIRLPRGVKTLGEVEKEAASGEMQAQWLIDRNRELTAKVAELEGQLRKVVRQAEPHNRRLFQSRKRDGINRSK